MTALGEVIRFTATTPNTNTKSGTYAVALPAGTAVVVAIDAPVVSAWSAPTFTDAAGNTYTLRQDQHGTPVNYQLAVFTAVLSSAVTTSTAWTATVTGANPAKWMVLGVGFSDVGAYDTGVSASGSSVSPSTGNTATGSQAAQTVVGAFAWTDSGLGAALTSADTVLAKASATDRSMTLTYRSETTAGTRAASGTLSTSQGWAGIAVALNQAGAAAAPQMYVRRSGSWVAHGPGRVRKAGVF